MTARAFILAGLCASALAACQPGSRHASPASPRPAAPKVDLSTPERALESYWARQGWYRGLAHDAFDQAKRKLPAAREVYGAVATGNELKLQTSFAQYPHEVLDRKIEGTRHETESRAVLLARLRNVTPVPEGAKPAPWEVERREKGAVFRYVLEKEPAGWKVAQIWQHDDVLAIWEKRADPAVWVTPSYPSDVYTDVGDEAGSQQIDLSTPRQALQSYWARKAWHYKVSDEGIQEAERTFPSITAVYGPVSTGEVLQYWSSFPKSPPDMLDRVIQSLKQESASRAVVVVRIRNVTPVPTGAKPTPDAVRQRKGGVLFRYVLEKEGADWKVAEVSRRSDSGWQKPADGSQPTVPYPSAVHGD